MNKFKVKFSTYCIVVTLAVLILLVVGLVSLRGIDMKMNLMIVIVVCLLAAGIFYCPVSIGVTYETVTIHRLLKNRIISYSDISSVERCSPSAGGLRLCGSGGFMGYWGYFHDIIIGSYFGYYGDRNQCVLIRLKSGRQYVVSCEQPNLMLEVINKYLPASGV